MKDGGHFAAFEEPKALAQDLRSFVAKVRARKAKDKKTEL